jgi:hypothetical protein
MCRYNRKVAKITAWEKSMKSKAESNLRALEASSMIVFNYDLLCALSGNYNLDGNG